MCGRMECTGSTIARCRSLSSSPNDKEPTPLTCLVSETAPGILHLCRSCAFPYRVLVLRTYSLLALCLLDKAQLATTLDERYAAELLYVRQIAIDLSDLGGSENTQRLRAPRQNGNR
jgi:hypothetical protein